MKQLAIVILAVIVIYSLSLRLLRERSNNSVEICMSWDETAEVLRRNALAPSSLNTYTLPGLLELCKILGVSSVSLKEESIDDLINSGKVIYFSRAETEKLKSLGLAAEDMIKTNAIWIKNDPELIKRVLGALDGLKLTLGRPAGNIKTKKTGDYTIIENPVSLWEDLLSLNTGFDAAKMELLRRNGLSFAHIITSADFTDIPENIYAGESYSQMQSAWIISDPASDSNRQKYGSLGEYPAAVSKSRLKIALFENNGGNILAGNSRYLAANPENILRSHTISPDEMKNMSVPAIKSRWVRAVKERSCRFLYFRWNFALSIEDNLGILRDVAGALKSGGFVLRARSLPSGGMGQDGGQAPNGFVDVPFRKFRLVLAFIVSVLGPLAALGVLRAKLKSAQYSSKNVFMLWSGSVLTAILTGLVVSALLPDTVFVNGLLVFRGVKFSILLPLVFAGAVFLGPKEFAELGGRKVTVTGLMVAGLALLSVYVMLERSGNYSTMLHPSELEVRSALENLLGARPRFKEFLIGYPLMLLGIYIFLRGKKGNLGVPGAAEERSGIYLPLFCVWAGTIGLVSVVNSFCHLHTPVLLVFLRTFHGFWIGGIMGFLLITLYRRVWEN